ncbi:uncharacterized protein LOC118436033 [Folsomia candida]|uniref:uncharacterized protein LOC118436033 n=1 Tax=Folsomia candida TaxID=158441 RepID=UPI001604F97C|nr:uncharacterized protein LOC118436033 [Folsomia candida]
MDWLMIFPSDFMTSTICLQVNCLENGFKSGPIRLKGEWEGQGRLFGSGDYNWELKNVSLKINARGWAPIDGASKITVSNVSVEMSHENHYTRQGLNFTNMTSELWSYNGTLGMHVRPYNWRQVIQDHRFLLEDFFYNVRYTRPPYQDTFKDSVAKQLQCVLNYTLNSFSYNLRPETLSSCNN